MNRAAVLGSPVAHSLSPVLHTAGYAALGLSDWSYGRREVTADQLAEVVAGLDMDWRGLSLTMPLKEVAFEVATTVSDVAARAGAINTLVRRIDGGWDATNTDVAGIVGALRHVLDADDAHETVVTAQVLGSGATARSAVLAIARLGIPSVEIAARNPATSAALAGLAEQVGLTADVVSLEDWAHDIAPLVVSTVPPAAGPALADLVEGAGDAAGATLLDVVYANWPTPLARAFAGAGGEVVSGLEMLVHQAAEQFELFTSRPAPLEAMLAAGRAALSTG